MPPQNRTALLLAGNGTIGQHVATYLAGSGSDVVIHHTGSRAIPQHPHIREILGEKTPPPITQFPQEAIDLAPDTVIHFYCMGAPDAEAFVTAFDGKAKRLVLVSSCDVYLAYGRFLGLEPGQAEITPISENAAIRTQLFPYRENRDEEHEPEYWYETVLENWYEKIEAERNMLMARQSEITILRLPKVFGAGTTDRLQTFYGFQSHPGWRWTHGYIANVAKAIGIAAFHPDAEGEIFNVGEVNTPSIGERLKKLPARQEEPEMPVQNFNFSHDLHFDTTKIRYTLGYTDVISEDQAMMDIAKGMS